MKTRSVLEILIYYVFFFFCINVFHNKIERKTSQQVDNAIKSDLIKTTRTRISYVCFSGDLFIFLSKYFTAYSLNVNFAL